MQNVRKFVTLQENLKSSSSQDPISTEKLVAFFSSRNSLNQGTSSDREDFLEDMNFSSDSPTRQTLRNLFLMGIEITCLVRRDLNS